MSTLTFLMRTTSVIHFVDRAQSVGPLLQRQTGVVGSGTMILPAGLDMEGMSEDNSEVFDMIVNIIRKHSAPRDKVNINPAKYFCIDFFVRHRSSTFGQCGGVIASRLTLRTFLTRDWAGDMISTYCPGRHLSIVNTI